MTGEIEFAVAFLGGYIQEFPSELLSGNVFAVSLLLMAIYFTVFIINKLTGLIIYSLKKLFLLSIVSLAFYQFVNFFLGKLLAEGATKDVILLGLGGFVAGSVALIISLYAAFRSVRKIKADEGQPTESPRQKQAEEDHVASGKGKTGTGGPLISMQSLKDDKSLGAVLTYLIISEFGVFSSKTISAPNSTVGLGFFLIFLAVAVVFIRQSYSDKTKGIRHLAVTLVVGGLLSLVLGYFWGGYPLSQMLSLEYFTTDSLVALVTGLSISLFMGSKS